MEWGFRIGFTEAEKKYALSKTTLTSLFKPKDYNIIEYLMLSADTDGRSYRTAIIGPTNVDTGLFGIVVTPMDRTGTRIIYINKIAHIGPKKVISNS